MTFSPVSELRVQSLWHAQQSQQGAGKRGLSGVRKARNGGSTGRVRCVQVLRAAWTCPVLSAAVMGMLILRRERRKRRRTASTGKTRTSRAWMPNRCQVRVRGTICFHRLPPGYARSKLSSVRHAGGFKSMKSRWLSEFEREQKEREAAAAGGGGGGSGGRGQGAPRAEPSSAQLAEQAADVHPPGTGNGVAAATGAGPSAAGAAVKGEPARSAPQPLGTAAAEAAVAPVPVGAAAQPGLGSALERGCQAASRPAASAGAGAAAAAGGGRSDSRGGDVGHAGLLAGEPPHDPAPGPGPVARVGASGGGLADGVPGSLGHAGGDAGTAPGSEHHGVRAGLGPARASAGAGPPLPGGAGAKREAEGTRAPPWGVPPATGAASDQAKPVSAARRTQALAAGAASEPAQPKPAAAVAVKAEAGEGGAGAPGAAPMELDPPAHGRAAKDPRRRGPLL